MELMEYYQYIFGTGDRLFDGHKKKGGKLKAIMEYVPPVVDFLQDLRVRLRVRKLVLYVSVAGDDPCDVALLYGKLAAGAGGLTALLEQWFRIKKRDIQSFLCNQPDLKGSTCRKLKTILSSIFPSRLFSR